MPFYFRRGAAGYRTLQKCGIEENHYITNIQYVFYRVFLIGDTEHPYKSVIWGG